MDGILAQPDQVGADLPESLPDAGGRPTRDLRGPSRFSTTGSASPVRWATEPPRKRPKRRSQPKQPGPHFPCPRSCLGPARALPQGGVDTVSEQAIARYGWQEPSGLECRARVPTTAPAQPAAGRSMSTTTGISCSPHQDRHSCPARAKGVTTRPDAAWRGNVSAARPGHRIIYNACWQLVFSRRPSATRCQLGSSQVLLVAGLVETVSLRIHKSPWACTGPAHYRVLTLSCRSCFATARPGRGRLMRGKREAGREGTDSYGVVGV